MTINSEINNNIAPDSSFLDQLALNVENQTKVIGSIHQDRSESKTSKQKFEDLHELAQRLILNAFSDNKEVTPSEPCPSASEFFKKKSVGKASDLLSTSLLNNYKCHVEISTGLVTALFNGVFLRDREDFPCNFSFFLYTERNHWQQLTERLT